MRRTASRLLLLALCAPACTDPQFLREVPEGDMDAGPKVPEAGPGPDADMPNPHVSDADIPDTDMPDAACREPGCCSQGTQWDGQQCTPVPRCAIENGGCPPDVECIEIDGRAECSACPIGFTMAAGDLCEPVLSDLQFSAGTLVPEFDPDVTAYALNAGLSPETLVVTPSSRSDAAITVAGGAVSSGKPAPAISLDMFAKRDVDVQIKAKDGKSRTYHVTLERTFSSSELLTASTPSEGAHFGRSVAISGDTLVVGASGDPSSAMGVGGDQTLLDAPGAGAAYVFRFDGSKWCQEAYLKATNTGAGDVFGHAVAIEGDLIAVGAVREDSKSTGIGSEQTDEDAPSSGAVYLYRRVGQDWKPAGYIKPSNTREYSLFGYSLALMDRVLAVGSPGRSASGDAENPVVGAGAAYIFEQKTPGDWTELAFIEADTPPDSSSSFGRSVALSGDTLAVGASKEDGPVPSSESEPQALQAGAVYIFRNRNGAWEQESHLRASNAGEYDQFGYHVALLGDLLVVGAPAEDGAPAATALLAGDSLTDSGAAYEFRRTGSTWAETAYIKPNGVSSGDRFGASLGFCGERALIVAAESDDGPEDQPDSGSLYAMVKDAFWTQASLVRLPSPAEGDLFGGHVDCSDRFIAVGAWQDHVEFGQAGSALVLE